jgi:hypothetical protein
MLPIVRRSIRLAHALRTAALSTTVPLAAAVLASVCSNGNGFPT